MCTYELKETSQNNFIVYNLSVKYYFYLTKVIIMKDFTLRNDTKLMFRNEPVQALAELINSRKTLFVFGGGSVKKNGCYNDAERAVKTGNGKFF